MLLLPSAAWADYTYGSDEDLYYEENEHLFKSGLTPIWTISMDGSSYSWPIANYSATPVTYSPFANFDKLTLTRLGKLKGELTGFALEGKISSNAYVNIMVYKLATKDATEGTKIGTVTINNEGTTPTYTYTAENGVSQVFNNEYIQIAFEHIGNEVSSIETDAITKIILTFSGTSYGLKIDDVRVTSNNADDILGDNKVSYSSNTLTLSDGASFQKIRYSGSDNLTIAFDGTVSISSSDTVTIVSTSDLPKLLFSSTNGSLNLSGNGVIGGFSDVDFGSLNLASISAQGVYYDSSNHHMKGHDTPPSELTITTEKYYPIWIYDPSLSNIGRSHTQLRGEAAITFGDNKTVSFDGNHTITIKNIDNFDYPSNTLIVVGPGMEQLTVNLDGASTVKSGSMFLSLWDTTALTFTTDKTSPGSLTAPEIVSWCDWGSGQISCKNGLVYNSEANPQTISTTGVRLKIGNTEVSASENITIAGGTASFDATNNTLTLTGATIGEATSVSDIIVLVDEFNLKISGTCTINGSITYSGSNIQTSSIQISNTDAASLTVSGSGISGFGNCSWSEGLYLSAVNSTGIPTDIHYEPYKTEEGEAGCMRSNYGEFSTISFSTTKPSESIWIGNTQVGGDGSFSGIEGVSFKSENNINILTLNNANLPSNIISSLPNLTINLTGEDGQNKGRSNLSANSHIISTNPSATLTFTTDGDNSLWETIDSYEIPWIGFADNPTFENKLVFLQAAGTMSIQVLQAPTMSYSSDNNSSGNLTFGGLSDSYGNKFDCYYTITYEDGDGSNSGPIKYEPGEGNQPNPVTMAEKPCTVTAYVTYKDRINNTTQSETAIGKYFGIADKTIVFNNDTKGSELKIDDLVIIPATKDEGVSFSFRGVNNLNNSDVISSSFSQETGSKYSIAGIGRCEVDMEIIVANPTIQVLNPFEGSVSEVKYAKGVVTVLPDKPSIVKDTEHEYIETDKITITRTAVKDEVADNIKIFYTWSGSDDVKVETYQQYVEGGSVSIYNPDEPIAAQTGTLRAWVGCQAGDNYYYNSEVVSEEFTVYDIAEMVWESESQTYGTYYNPDKDMAVPSGSTAYIVTGISEDGTKVTISPVSYIKAGVAVLIERDKTTEVSKTTDFSGSKMAYSDPDTPAKPSATDKWYVIYNNKFVKVTTGTEVSGGKCYLNLNGTSSSGTRSYYDIDGSDGTTGIREVKSEGVKGEKLADGAWHDLQGRKFTTKPTKPGLYILNGKKIVVK